MAHIEQTKTDQVVLWFGSKVFYSALGKVELFLFSLQ